MNLNILEKLARRAFGGENIESEGKIMLKGGYLTPAEHRSLSSLSWQIAANVQANNGAALSVGPFPEPARIWI